MWYKIGNIRYLPEEFTLLLYFSPRDIGISDLTYKEGTVPRFMMRISCLFYRCRRKIIKKNISGQLSSTKIKTPGINSSHSHVQQRHTTVQDRSKDELCREALKWPHYLCLFFWPSVLSSPWPAPLKRFYRKMQKSLTHSIFLQFP